MGKKIRIALLAALCLLQRAPAHAEADFGTLSFTGYADFRVLAPPPETAWLNGGLSKFRYGGNGGQFPFCRSGGCKAI